MKYCSKCKKVHINTEIQNCPACKRKLIENPNGFSPVNIITANGFELERIKSALADSEIPFSVKEERYDTGLQILNSAPPENCSFFVPLSHYDKAVETLIGIGALSEEAVEEIDKADKEYLEKARLIRIFSFLGFIAVLVGFSFLVDYLLSFITPLLGWSS